MIRVLVTVIGLTLSGVAAAPAAMADGPYANCTEAHNDGRWDIPQNDPDYWDDGDRDHDGYACDSPDN